jgi:hypothetical protein
MTSFWSRAAAKSRAVDEQRAGERADDSLGARQHALEWVGDVVRLVDHIGRLEIGALLFLGFHQFVENKEQLVRVDGAGVEVVVAIFAVVEMEAAEFSEAGQARDDLLDIDVGRVVPQIDETERLGAQLLGSQNVGAPVRDDRRIEGGLIELVLDEQAPIVGQFRVNGALRFPDSGRANRAGSAGRGNSCRRRSTASALSSRV